MQDGLLTIGELARRTGAPVETIRYYEREGLLPEPARSDANYRLYGNHHFEQLQFVRHCRSLDMTHDEIRSLLAFREAPEANCAEVNLLLDRHINHVADRIAELTALQAELMVLRGLCQMTQQAKDCGILQGIAQADGRAPANLGSHKGNSH